jgi:hypothetical protein
MQCIYSSVSKAESPENGSFLGFGRRLSGILGPKKFERQSPETIGDEKSPHLARLSHQGRNIL